MWSEAEYLTTAVGGKRPFFVQAAAGARNLSISVTDFARLWTESLTPGEFANRLKDLNPRLEADSEVLMDEMRRVVLGQQSKAVLETKLDQVSSSQPLDILFTFKYDVLQLKWRCVLRKAEPEEFYAKVVLPLLRTISHHQRRESALFDLLAAKDREIDHQRLQNRKVERTGKETQKFRPSDWSMNDLNFTGSQRAENVAKLVVSNDVFMAVSKADPDAMSIEGTSADQSLFQTRPTDISPTSGNEKCTPPAVDGVTPSEFDQSASIEPSSKGINANEESPPSPPSLQPRGKKKKKLRL